LINNLKYRKKSTMSRFTNLFQSSEDVIEVEKVLKDEPKKEQVNSKEVETTVKTYKSLKN